MWLELQKADYWRSDGEKDICAAGKGQRLRIRDNEPASVPYDGPKQRLLASQQRLHSFHQGESLRFGQCTPKESLRREETLLVRSQRQVQSQG